MTGYTFNQLFDFTRTTAATFVGSNGLIQTTPASVNLLTFTQEFDNGAWVKGAGATVAANNQFAPDGTPTADTITFTAGGAAEFVRGFASFTVGLVYTVSVYARLVSGTPTFVFDVGNGAAVSGAQTVTSTWQRFSFTFTFSGANQWFDIEASAAGSIAFWGAQLQLGSTATTYARNNGGLFPPRFDYDPVTLAPRGILIEEQRTNLATYSNTFSDASWVAISVKDLVANSTVSPDGGVNASTLTDSSAVAYQGMGKTVTVANDNTAYTASIYVRKTTGGTSPTFGFNLQLTGGTLVGISPRLNTDTGALLSGSGTVQNAGAYWRLTATITNNTSGNTSLGLSVYPATATHNSGTDSAAATGSAILYGAQIEIGTFATSYIPTVASQVTRTADVCNIVAPMFAPWYNQSAGTLLAEFAPTLIPAAGSRVFSINDGTSANRILSSPSITSHLLVVAGGVSQADLDGGTPTANVINKTAAAYALNDFAVSLNAGATATDTSGTVPVVSSFNIGSENGSSQLNGYIRRITYYPFRASNNQLQALST